MHIEPYKFLTKKLQINQKTLEEKIQHSKELIQEAVQTYGNRVAVACSWGKDSMVLLHLARTVNPDIPIFSVLTIFKPKETFEFIVKVVQQYTIKPHIFMVGDTIPEVLTEEQHCCHIIIHGAVSYTSRKNKKRNRT